MPLTIQASPTATKPEFPVRFVQQSTFVQFVCVVPAIAIIMMAKVKPFQAVLHAILFRCLLAQISPSPSWVAATKVQEYLGFVNEAVSGTAEQPWEAGAPWGLSTFANIPHVPCQSPNNKAGYDIAVLGAPFDTVRHSSLPH